MVTRTINTQQKNYMKTLSFTTREKPYSVKLSFYKLAVKATGQICLHVPELHALHFGTVMVAMFLLAAVSRTLFLYSVNGIFSCVALSLSFICC